MSPRTQAARTRLAQPCGAASRAAPKAILCDETSRACAEQYGDRLRAIVLTGSLARDEATFVRHGQHQTLLGDADFLLIFRERRMLPPARDLELLRDRIEASLDRRGIGCHVTLGVVDPRFLRGLSPTIFAYELQVSGRIVWGEPDILSLVPPLSAGDIPLADAWRLLANRIIEQLEIVTEFGDEPVGLSRQAMYRTIKLYLDMTTSFLVFVGAYAPTYAERLQKLRVVAASEPASGDRPFPLHAFAEAVAACTRWKLCGDLPTAEVGREFWERAVDDAEHLWCWELARLTGVSQQVSRLELFEHWTRLQPLRERLRGWLYTARQCGWHKSWRNWRKWIHLGCRASARYWVYAAGSELLFELPALAIPGRSARYPVVDLAQLRSWLPVLSQIPPEEARPTWGALASDVLRNYRQFLTETRA